MFQGRFTEINNFLATEDPSKMNLNLALAILAITLPGRDKMPSRKDFFNKLQAHLGPDQNPFILGGLE